MRSHHPSWRGVVLPLAGLALLLPVQATLAQAGDAAKGADQQQAAPLSEQQVKDYNRGVDAWEGSYHERGPNGESPSRFELAARQFEKAIQGGEFPEARLALGEVYYRMGDLTRAQEQFQRVADTMRGVLKAEALGFLGIVAMRQNRMADAKRIFSELLDENCSDENSTSSAQPDRRFNVIRSFRDRCQRVHCVGQVGFIMASFYAARELSTDQQPAAARQIVADMDRLIPGDEVRMCDRYFDDRETAMWRFPGSTPDWTLNLPGAVPAGVRVSSVSEMLRAVRAWAFGVSGVSGAAPVSAENLTDQDRENIHAGVSREMVNAENAGDWGTALQAAHRLAESPDTAMLARQHEIAIHITGDKNFQAAREAIHGPGAADDPMIYQETLALASAEAASQNVAGARQEYREVAEGIPGVERRATPQEQRVARLNLAALESGQPLPSGANSQADYEAEELAAQASRMAQQQKPVTPEEWQPILDKLKAARDAAHSPELKQRLAAGITQIEEFQNGYADVNNPQHGSAVTVAWNNAAEETTRANESKTPQDWNQAARLWRVALTRLPDPADKSAAAAHYVAALQKKADAYYYRLKDHGSAQRALMDVRAAVGEGPHGVGQYLPADVREAKLTWVRHNYEALQGQLLYPKHVVFHRYQGPLVQPTATRYYIMRYIKAHQPNVNKFLAELEHNPRAMKSLVDWFNNGPMARKADHAKRNFSANPHSPNYLITFLRENLNPDPGGVPPGFVQWVDENGTGPWKGTVSHHGIAAYFLKNGAPLVNAYCANPLSPIRVTSVPWVPSKDTAGPRQIPVPPAPPTVAFTPPFRPSQILPPTPELPVSPPALTMLLRPCIVPRLNDFEPVQH